MIGVSILTSVFNATGTRLEIIMLQFFAICYSFIPVICCYYAQTIHVEKHDFVRKSACSASQFTIYDRNES